MAAGLVPLAFCLFILAVLVPRVDPESLLRSGTTLLLTAALPGIMAYQLLLGKGRVFSWIAAAILAGAVIQFLSLFLNRDLGQFSGYIRPYRAICLSVLLLLPLAYLIAEMIHGKLMRPREESGEWAANRQRADHTIRVAFEWGVSIALTIACGYLLERLPGIGPRGDNGGGLPMVLVCVWVATFLHEAGHAIAGWAVGFAFTRFYVAPFELMFLRGKIHAQFRPKFFGGHYWGTPKYAGNLSQRHAIMTAWGPGANLITFLLCWMALYLMKETAPPFIRVLMDMSLILAVGNLAPLRIKGIRTDGRRLWEAFFDPAAEKRSLAVIACTASRSSSLRPREWPAEYLAVLRQDSEQLGSAILLYYWAQDHLIKTPDDPAMLADLSSALATMDRLLPKIEDKRARNTVLFLAAWIRSRYYGHVDGAEETIEPARTLPSTDPHEILRLQAALAAAQGDRHEAVRLLDQAEHSLKDLPPTGLNMSDLEDVCAYRAILAN